MQIVDFHCDVLSKLLLDEGLSFQASDTGALDVTYERLRDAGTVLQTFAIYIPRRLNGTITPILDSIDLFYEKVLSCGGMRLVRTPEDVEHCIQSGETGAILSLEGVDGLQGKLSNLRLLYKLGVRAAGLTWNHANWAADGAMEPRGGGLTSAGRDFVKECNRLGIIVDVSHLSEGAFWDVAALSQRPIIASHSNARAICDHPRNLSDGQIAAIIEQGGLIGVTYVPWFVRETAVVTIDDLLRHIDHICALGGQNQLMLGSDFDGIDSYIAGLTHPGQLDNLRDALLKRYTEEQAASFLSGNAIRYLKCHLPSA